MKRLDAWLGKTLFQPPIIALCQRTGITQYAVHRYLWWALFMWILWRDADSHWAILVVLVAFALIQTLVAGLAPDFPVETRPWFRRILLAIFLITILVAAASGEVPGVGECIAMLFAEYALTIKTIPPLEDKRVTGGRAQEAGL